MLRNFSQIFLKTRFQKGRGLTETQHNLVTCPDSAAVVLCAGADYYTWQESSEDNDGDYYEREIMLFTECLIGAKHYAWCFICT